MADYVWLEEIERLEAERNDGKTLDGYDCTFSTPAPVNATVTTKNGVTYLHLEGTFVHSVGRDGVLKNRCEAVYDTSGDVRYLITR